MVLVLVLIDFLLLVSSWRYLRNLLAAGDMFIASVKKGKPELRKKGISLLSCLMCLVMPAVVVRQRKAWRRKNGMFLYFEGAFLGGAVNSQITLVWSWTPRERWRDPVSLDLWRRRLPIFGPRLPRLPAPSGKWAIIIMFPMTSLLSDLHCLFQTIWNLGGFSLVVCSCVGHGVRRRKQARNRSKPVDQPPTLFLWNLQRIRVKSVYYFIEARGMRWSILWERIRSQVSLELFIDFCSDIRCKRPPFFLIACWFSSFCFYICDESSIRMK